MDYLYHLKNIHKTRHIGNVMFALHVPEFRVKAGEFIAIVGPSGCGKSTLLDLLALVLKPDESSEGFFRFRPNKDGAAAADIYEFWMKRRNQRIAAIRRRHIGYVLQTGGLLPFFSVRHNIGLTCRLNGMGARVEARVEETAAKLGILDQLEKKPQFLSGGQRQRVAIARALAHQPSVVLADEPTAAVDIDRAKAIVAEFRQLALEGKAGIVMVTHDRKLVENVADRMITFRLIHTTNGSFEKTISTLIDL
jgi:putative ABC transport system ATP-binding protein